eukprot:SM000027S09637  [mRNA]  locus=s27:466883:468620:- [translate_table: standard]
MAKRRATALLELEARHEHYDSLIARAAEGLVAPPGMAGSARDLHAAARDDVAAAGEAARVAEVAPARRGVTFEGPAEPVGLSSPDSIQYGEPKPPPTSAAGDLAGIPAAVHGVGPGNTWHGVSTAQVSGPPGLSTINEDQADLGIPPKLLALIEQAAEDETAVLNLSQAFGHQLKYVPESLCELTNLTHLNLGENQLELLPVALGDLVSLTTLDVHSNKLRELPESLGSLVCLTALDFQKNFVEELPWTIANCRQLQRINGDFNNIKALPEGLGQLSNLERLTLHLNQIERLPTTIGEMTALTHLDVHFNHLEAVPDAIGKLSRLATLDVSSNFNDLRSLPHTLGYLESLTDLNISNNRIRHLPLSFAQLTGLRKLRMEGNPWRTPPLSIVEQGKDAVMAYMDDLLSKEDDDKKGLTKKKSSLARIVGGGFSKVFGLKPDSNTEPATTQMHESESELNLKDYAVTI